MRSTIFKSFGWDAAGSYFSSDTRNVAENYQHENSDEMHDMQEMHELNPSAEDDASIEKTNSDKSVAESDDFEGPDTSSLPAFLISLLTRSSPKINVADHSSSSTTSSGDSPDEEEGGDERKSHSDGRDYITEPKSRLGFSYFSRSSPYRNSQKKIKKVVSCEEHESEQEKDGLTKAKPATSDKYSAEEDDRKQAKLSESDWQMVSDSDLSLSGDSTPVKQAEAPPPPSPPKSPFRLPDVSEESLILTDAARRVIYDALPALARGREWVLLYSTVKHGISLLTLYRKSMQAQGPCLLAVANKEGDVFGGLSAGPLLPSTKKKYQGSSDSFVFSDVCGSPQLFRSSGRARCSGARYKDAGPKLRSYHSTATQAVWALEKRNLTRKLGVNCEERSERPQQVLRVVHERLSRLRRRGPLCAPSGR